MDMNGHINNVTYLGWALETVPADVYLNYSLQEVYRASCKKLSEIFACRYPSVRMILGAASWRQQKCPHAQVEIDYKSECMAGQTVESLGSHIEEDTNGTGLLRFACTSTLPTYALHISPA